jgi:predicted nucleotidyltransferase
MTPITADLILMVVNKIATAVHPDRIVLFGSWARGSAGPNSDMDLIVVESEPFTAGRSRRKETARIEMALKDLTVPVDLLLYSRDEMERWASDENHILSRAMREGKVLYGRP